MALAEVPSTPRDQVGGKAWQLGALNAAGLPVPAAFVVPTTAFRDLVWRAGLLPLAERVAREPTAAAELHPAILGLVVPEALREAWVAAARALGPRVAVRSSGVDEDGATRSFAGQHLTRLGVAPEDVPEAIVACWASLYAPGAVAYRGGAGPAPASLAVVVQELVNGQSAGVMFTVDPASGSWRELVIEAVWGLGEGLVSGRIAPQYLRLRRPRELPRPLSRVAARVRLQIVDDDLPDQPERFVPGPDGVSCEPVPAELRGRRPLDPSAARRLGRLGLKIERALGEPVDVEWVRGADGGFRVLQARPITATGTPRPAAGVLWTRRFVGERWTEPATPLGWSILAPILEYHIAYPQTQERLLGGGPPLRLVHGRPYVNATVFRHLAFKLPGAPPPSFMLELVPPTEERAWRRRFAVAPDLAVYASIFRTTFAERRWERFRWNPFTNHLAWARFEAALEAELPTLVTPAGPVTPAEAVARVERHLGWIRDYVGIHICSLLFANLAWQLLEGALAAWLPERRAALMEGLACSPPGNLTVETNEALHALALRATDADLAALGAGAPLAEPFATALGAFLDRFGHRSESSWELMSPRWRRAPARLVPLLRAQRQVNEAPLDRARHQEARHQQSLAELRAALTGPRLTTAELAVHYARRYLLLRENQRFWFDRLLASLQDTVSWLGRWLVDQRLLADPDDVALLTWPELRGLAAGERPADLAVRIERRRAERVADAAVDPPTFLLGDDPGPDDPAASRLTGLGISPGRVRGQVRVVKTFAEGQALAPGEILVTRSVDPGWTPLFLTASAVVLELGSLLSHGAVVAREYGVPAVVNIDRATKTLHTGQWVTVDGTRGVVWVEPG
ncbi:MAG: PEP/pyruvate-binding domain-containing protein [Myxococcota bacterium]